MAAIGTLAWSIVGASRLDHEPAAELAQPGTDAGDADAKTGWLARLARGTPYTLHPAAIVADDDVQVPEQVFQVDRYA